MFTPWNLGFVCLGGRNARINVECLNLVRQGGVIPLGFSHSLGNHPTKLHQLIKRVELFYFVCRMKLVFRLDEGRWSRIFRVWEIVKNRDLTPDDGSRQGSYRGSRHQVEILHKCQKDSALLDLMAIAGRSDRTKFRDQVLIPFAGLATMTIPNRPRSGKQRYRLTEKGREWLDSYRKGIR